MELPAHVRALFEATNYAHLATILPGGAPHSVPVWMDIEDGKIAFLTSPNSRKGRNLAADPQVAISITDHDNPYAMALVRGRVTARVDGDPAWEIIDRIAIKYTGQPYQMRTDRAVYLVEADHVSATSFG